MVEMLLTILFNPPFLLFLLGVFFLGKLVGRLASRPSVWKVLVLCYLGVFLFEPLRNSGWFLGGIFLIGFFSGAIRSLPGILMWSESLSDILFALRYRRAYEGVKAREQAFENDQRRAREAAAQASSGRSRTQDAWRRQARQERPSSGKEQSAGRGDGAGPTSGGAAQQREGAEKPRFARPPGDHGKASASSSIRDRHLQTLGLKPGQKYSLHEIKKAYRRKVMKAHPDAGGSRVEFIAVVNAYEWLRTCL
jgi:hypothetical protein